MKQEMMAGKHHPEKGEFPVSMRDGRMPALLS